MNNLNGNQQEKVCGAGGLELPEAFCNRMKQELGGEAEAFLASYRAPRQQALPTMIPSRSEDSRLLGIIGFVWKYFKCDALIIR